MEKEKYSKEFGLDIAFVIKGKNFYSLDNTEVIFLIDTHGSFYKLQNGVLAELPFFLNLRNKVINNLKLITLQKDTNLRKFLERKTYIKPIELCVWIDGEKKIVSLDYNWYITIQGKKHYLKIDDSQITSITEKDLEDLILEKLEENNLI